ncbi:Hypothetical predicted protein [Octopus vulgaris]|uniref:DUF4817 domain-containing protein n=1 Tax=Octopus vulgaris TaxID=6645 RepID=A0AA36B6X0_OCTVU|nr:Hypothetical predicted protein [Octopus vulgaris]
MAKNKEAHKHSTYIYIHYMAGNLTNEERKWILKQYWKTGNAELVRQKWTEEFQRPAPSRLTVYRIRNKFEQTGILKYEQPVTNKSEFASTSLERQWLSE